MKSKKQIEYEKEKAKDKKFVEDTLFKNDPNEIHPPTNCSICKDKKGKMSKEYCLDNSKHPTYAERYDCWDGLTYLDCWAFIRSNETKEEYEKRIHNN